MVEEANDVKIGDDRYDDHVKELLKQHGLSFGSGDGLISVGLENIQLMVPKMDLVSSSSTQA